MLYYLQRFFWEIWCLFLLVDRKHDHWMVYLYGVVNNLILSLIVSSCIESFLVLLTKAFVVMEFAVCFLLCISLIAVVIRLSIVTMLIWFAFISDIVNINWIWLINFNGSNNATISVKNAKTSITLVNVAKIVWRFANAYGTKFYTIQIFLGNTFSLPRFYSWVIKYSCL